MRSGKYKLLDYFEKDTYELYDLSTDASEENNLMESLPDVAKKMKADMAAGERNTLKMKITSEQKGFLEQVYKSIINCHGLKPVAIDCPMLLGFSPK